MTDTEKREPYYWAATDRWYWPVGDHAWQMGDAPPGLEDVCRRPLQSQPTQTDSPGLRRNARLALRAGAGCILWSFLWYCVITFTVGDTDTAAWQASDRFMLGCMLAFGVLGSGGFLWTSMEDDE